MRRTTLEGNKRCARTAAARTCFCTFYYIIVVHKILRRLPPLHPYIYNSFARLRAHKTSRHHNQLEAPPLPALYLPVLSSPRRDDFRGVKRRGHPQNTHEHTLPRAHKRTRAAQAPPARPFVSPLPYPIIIDDIICRCRAISPKNGLHICTLHFKIERQIRVKPLSVYLKH